MRRLLPVAVSAIALGAVAGCSLAPEDGRPEVPAPAAYKEANDWKPAVPSDETPRGAWWRVFGDATLNALEQKVSTSNQDLKAAATRYTQARAVARQTSAALYPEIAAGGSAALAQRSANVTPVIKPLDYSDNLLDVTASWELDLWGRVRNATASSESRAQESAATLAAVALSLHAELAAEYFDLRNADARAKVQQDTIAAYEKALELITRRKNDGVAAASDVAQAQVQLQVARTLLSDTRMKRAQLEHAIAVLAGELPPQFSLRAVGRTYSPPPVDPGFPSSLLERRPDVAAAERQVIAANADIGVARAAWFPVFNFRTLVGYESASAGAWFSAPSRVWALGPSVLMPLFDGGRIRAGVDRAEAARDKSAAVYRQAVMVAYRDVEDQLAALRWLAQETRTQAAAVSAARLVLMEGQRRYDDGLVTYLEVVSAENALLAAELAAVDIHSRRMIATVRLIQALGGGWRDEPA